MKRQAWICASWIISGLIALSMTTGTALAQTPPAGTSSGTKSAPGGAASVGPQPTGDAEPVLQEVVITATGTNISGIAPVGSETLGLSRSDILDSGFTDLHDVLRSLPQIVDVAPAGVANYREGGTAGYGGNVVQGTSVNLRGLGPQATLVLVDGHRVTPTGSQGVFTDANQVPLAAIQRVDIVDDGNSAIYGSDAVGGVVNYVMRKDLDGVELGGRATFVHGYHEDGGSITGGHTWDSFGPFSKGNFILAVDYDRRSAMPESASPLLSDNHLAIGGIDNRIRAGSTTTGALNGGAGAGQPGNVGTAGAVSNINWCDNYSAGFPPFVPASCTSATYLYRGLPQGATPTSFGQTLAQPSLTNRSDDTDYLGRMWRWQVSMFYNQDINSSVSVFFEGFWTKRDTFSSGSQYSGVVPPQVTIQPGSPYYITPPGPAGGPMVVNLAASALGIAPFGTDNPDTNWTAITGLTAQLGHDWSGTFSATVGRDRTCGECQIGDNFDTGAFQHYVNIGVLNPLQTTPFTADQLALFMGSNIQKSEMGIEDYVLKFNGPLFELPSGTVRAAVGGEFYHNTESIANGANRTDAPAEGIEEDPLPPPDGYASIGCYAPLPCPPRTRPNQFAWDNIDSSSRHVSSAFAEFYLPLVGPANNVPWVQSLSFDAAGRFDHYSDFGSTSNPKLGLTWKLDDDISIRGSWGTSYRAPSLTDLNPFVFSAKVYVGAFPNLTGNPNFGTQIAPGLTLANTAFVIGDQSHLEPERARNWSTGLDLTPHWVDGLKISATYYHIDYTNQIFAPTVFPGSLLSPTQYQIYSSFVHPVHNPATCTPGNPSTYDPALLPFLSAVGIYGIIQPSQICQIQVWLDGRNTNIGSTTDAGVDLNINYLLKSSLGTWITNLNVNRVTTERIAYVSSEPQIGVLGTIGNLVPWRGRASLGWNRGPFGATAFANYVGAYLNNTPLPGHANAGVASWTTVDLNLSFDFGKLSNPGWLNGTVVSLSSQNLFNRDPPLALTATGTAFDANNANVFGRIVSLQATKKF